MNRGRVRGPFKNVKKGVLKRTGKREKREREDELSKE